MHLCTCVRANWNTGFFYFVFSLVNGIFTTSISYILTLIPWGKNMLVEPYNASWEILPANDVKESPSTYCGIKCQHTNDKQIYLCI